MLFEVCGRNSDIGYGDGEDVFMGYHVASCAAFATYAKSKLDKKSAKICKEGLDCMYMRPKSVRSRAAKYIFERCHDLDLFRCYGGDKMRGKLKMFEDDVSRPFLHVVAVTKPTERLSPGSWARSAAMSLRAALRQPSSPPATACCSRPGIRHAQSSGIALNSVTSLNLFAQRQCDGRPLPRQSSVRQEHFPALQHQRVGEYLDSGPMPGECMPDVT